MEQKSLWIFLAAPSRKPIVVITVSPVSAAKEEQLKYDNR